MEPPLATDRPRRDGRSGADRLQVGDPAVLVLDGGHPIGIVTRSDLLSFLERT
jgi:CBS domain-containing protein